MVNKICGLEFLRMDFKSIIMTTQPFTAAGVAAKLTELYALSDSDLLTQANQIRTNLQNWMADNFTLDTAQTLSLRSLDADYVSFTSFLVGFAVQRRGPIVIDKQGTESSGKLLHTGGNLAVQFGPSGFAMTGGVVIQVTYS